VRELFVTDSVTRPDDEPEAVRVVSIAPLLAAAIQRQLVEGPFA
jgi:phosphoribosylpyrophosphate synthetase